MKKEISDSATPWRIEKEDEESQYSLFCIRDADGLMVIAHLEEHDAARIVACVNYLEGVPVEEMGHSLESKIEKAVAYSQSLRAEQPLGRYDAAWGWLSDLH